MRFPIVNNAMVVQPEDAEYVRSHLMQFLSVPGIFVRRYGSCRFYVKDSYPSSTIFGDKWMVATKIPIEDASREVDFDGVWWEPLFLSSLAGLPPNTVLLCKQYLTKESVHEST